MHIEMLVDRRGDRQVAKLAGTAEIGDRGQQRALEHRSKQHIGRQPLSALSPRSAFKSASVKRSLLRRVTNPSAVTDQAIPSLLSLEHDERCPVADGHAGCPARSFQSCRDIDRSPRRVRSLHQRPQQQGRALARLATECVLSKQMIPNGASSSEIAPAKLPGDGLIRPVVAPEPFQCRIAILGRWQARGERFDRGNDSIAQWLAVHRGERGLGRPRRQ